jgi:hypothetical protein
VRRGFPIRRPSDHSSFISSPRLIADYRVLHRLLMPRHPPCALKNLPHDQNTPPAHPTATPHHHPPQGATAQHHDTATGGDQFTNTTPPPHGHHHPRRSSTVHARSGTGSKRCSRPLYSSQTTTRTPHTQCGGTPEGVDHHRRDAGNPETTPPPPPDHPPPPPTTGNSSRRRPSAGTCCLRTQ